MYAVKINNNEKTRVLSDNYIILKQIGSGSFGEVFLAQRKDGGYVAAKIEEKNRLPRILNEYKIYRYLDNKGFKIGLPKIYDFYQTPSYNIMFMQLLGPSLEDLFNKYGRQFKQETVSKLADQLITLLESLHKAHFIHRDIKPNNFLIGRENSDQLYIMDFGLSKKYMNYTTHIPFRDKRSLIGTARYASINMHFGIEPTRRDDLESVGYMLIYFLKGSLPWQGMRKKRSLSNLEKIKDMKVCIKLEELCSGLPACFSSYLAYCRKLKFDEEPDYEYLRGLFANSTKKYEWENA
jgi:serine/threonine protein kinase